MDDCHFSYMKKNGIIFWITPKNCFLLVFFFFVNFVVITKCWREVLCLSTILNLISVEWRHMHLKVPRWKDKMGIAYPPITLFKVLHTKLLRNHLGILVGFVNGNWIYAQTRYQKGIDWYCNKSETREKISAKGHVTKGLFVTWEVI
jgi:hypothetical protein